MTMIGQVYNHVIYNDKCTFFVNSLELRYITHRFDPKTSQGLEISDILKIDVEINQEADPRTYIHMYIHLSVIIILQRIGRDLFTAIVFMYIPMNTMHKSASGSFRRFGVHPKWLRELSGRLIECTYTYYGVCWTSLFTTSFSKLVCFLLMLWKLFRYFKIASQRLSTL